MTSYQNWEPVIFKNKVEKTKHTNYEISNETKIMNDYETLNHEKVSMTLAKMIQKARIAKGYKTQKEFAQMLNLKPDIVNSYENGKAIPDNHVLQKMRRILNVKLSRH